jgi:hypothetical protein
MEVFATLEVTLVVRHVGCPETSLGKELSSRVGNTLEVIWSRKGNCDATYNDNTSKNLQEQHSVFSLRPVTVLV